MRRNGCLIALALLLTLLAGAAGGALFGGLAALSIERGYEPPVISAWIPTRTPTVTPVPSVTPSPTPEPTLTPTVALPTLTPLPTATPALADIVARVQPSVVTVLVYFEDDFTEPVAIGSGVSLFEDTLIVTNHHVIEEAEVIRVQGDDDIEYEAELVGSDFLSDLAVLRVTGATFTPLVLESGEPLRVGDPVFTVGAALGDFRNSVTTGIISGLNRSLYVQEAGFAYESLIQTDAAINPGNSGGPLLDAQGDLIGINTLVVRGDGSGVNMGEGLGFAIPAPTVASIAGRLIADGEIARPYFGVRHELVTFENVLDYGLESVRGEAVLGVETGSPAEAAGIQRGDVLLAFNDEPIDEDHPFINLLMRQSAGDTVTVRLFRDGGELDVSVTLGERD